MIRHIGIHWLVPTILGALFAAPVLAQAENEDDLDVTMRMVSDDQELDDSFVQQLELPEFADDPPATIDAFGEMQTESEDFASETREDLLNIEDTLSEQSRESRDALGIELPGEMVVEEPELELPGADDDDLNLLNDEPLDPNEPQL